MSRKSKNVSFDLRQLVIFHREKGNSYRQIAAILNLKKSTVADIVNRYKNENRIESLPQSGRPKIISEREKRVIIRKVKKNPRLSAPILTAELREESGKNISPQTVRRVLKEAGYNGRVAIKKPYISETNRKKRLTFAKHMISKEESWWSDVIFVDESKFNISGSDGRHMVWRTPSTALNPKNLRATVKHGGGNVMVWSCISSRGVGKLVFIEDTMDKNKYLHILQENLMPSAVSMNIERSFKFYQDNDPKHTARIIQEYLLYNCPKVLHPPPQSPDLNPIENLWNNLNRRIRTTPIKNKEELKIRLLDEWEKTDIEYLKKIIFSMPKHLKHVIKQKGYATKY